MTRSSSAGPSSPPRYRVRQEQRPPLELLLVGPFELRRHGTPVRMPRKAQALLAYLAVNRNRPAPKEKLATLLWGHTGSEQARASLRQCLVALRHALGETAVLLQADGQTIALADSPEILVDIDEFLECARSESMPDLERAHALYRDAFLAGMHIPIEPFERWSCVPPA